MTAAAARFLPHFSSRAFPGFETEQPFRSLTETEMATSSDGGGDLVRAAVDAALTQARAEFEAQRSADLVEHERQMAERERLFAENTADALSARLSAGLGEINDAVGRHVARIMVRFLEHAVRQRSVNELSETVAALLADGGAARLTVSGPADLVDRLRASAIPAKMPVNAIVSEAADVTVTIDDTVIETRIAAWVEQAIAAVGDGAT